LHLRANLPGELTALSQTPSWMKVGKKGRERGRSKGENGKVRNINGKNRNKEREGRKGGRGWEEGEGKSGKGGRSPILVSKSRRL